MIRKVFMAGLALLLLGGVVFAEPITDYGIGFSETGSYAVTEYSEHFQVSGSNGKMYFLLSYSGSHNITLSLASAGGFTTQIYYMNSDKNWILSKTCPVATTLCSDIVTTRYNLIHVAITYASGASEYTLYKNSTITLTGDGVTDFNFTEGGSATLPFVTKYTYPVIWAYDESETSISSPLNSTPYFFADAQFSCDIDGNSTDVTIYNFNELDFLNFQTYSYPVNILQYPDLNISPFSHAPNSTIIAGLNENVTFSAIINHPEVISYFGYMVDDVVVASDTSDFDYVFSSGIAGNYSVKKFFIDNCGQFPTVEWFVLAGDTISLSGTVFGHTYLGDYVPLFPATVILSDGLNNWVTHTESLAGDYSFTGLGEGLYNISASADGYNSSTYPLNMSYLDFQNPTLYGHDITLEQLEEYGASCFSVVSEGGLDWVHYWDFSFYWEGVLVLSISNDAVVYDYSPTLFTPIFNTSVGSSICVTNIPIGYNYTAKISKEGYVTPEGYPVFEDTWPVEVPWWIWTDYLTVELVSNESGGDVWGSTSIDLSFPDITSKESIEGVDVSYTASGVHIPGASCTYSCSAVDPSSGVLDEYYDFYSSWVSVNDSGNFTISATCSKSGYPTLTASKSFESYEDYYTSVDWVSAPLNVVLGDSATFSVIFTDVSGGYGIYDGACTFHLNNTLYSMSPLPGYQGRYYYTYIIPAEGVYQYYVNCSKAFFTPSVSSTQIVSVSSEIVTPPMPNHCFNGYLDPGFGETDVDCGGADCAKCELYKSCILDSDCLSGFCDSGVCRLPSCSDNIMNGDETGVDCGGSCPPCICFYDWDCASDGSQDCISNECITTNCSNNSDCPSLLWYDPIHTYYSRDRRCYNGLCGFLFMNESFNLSMKIHPLVEYRVWNDSGRTVYLSYCDDGSNGFIVVTPNPSRKWFFYSDPVYYSPYVSPSSNIVFGSINYERESTAVLDALCSLNSSQNRTYALVTFTVLEGGSNYKYQSVYTLTFRKSFSVSASRLADDKVKLNLTRPGLCFYRQDSVDSWTGINAVELLNITWNTSTSDAYDIFCNNSFGESATTSFNAGSREIFLFAFDVFGMLLTKLWFAIVGSTFVWHGWYILPLAILVLFTLPTLFLIFLSSRYHHEK